MTTPWAGGPYGGPVIAGAPPGQVIPPAVPPGATGRYFYSGSAGTYPWAYGGWAGAAPAIPALVGGLVVTPDPAHGVARVMAWWPDAAALLLVRVTPDGTRTPVRGGYAATLPPGTTRRNLATDPTNANQTQAGYVPADGNPTLTAVTDSPAAAGTGVRATVAAAGSCGATVPTALSGNPGQPVTVGATLRTSSTATGVTISIAWTEAGGNALAASTAALTGDQLAAASGQWARAAVTATVPSGVAPVTGTVKVVAAGLPAGGSLDLTMISAETAGTDGSYVDGDTLGGQWTGTPGLSTSVWAAPVTVVDGECPLDTPVTYVAYQPSLTGGSVAATPVVLDSQGQVWLTHPSTPTAPVGVDLRTKPKRTYSQPRGVFAPINRLYPIVITGQPRKASTGNLGFNAITAAEHDALMALFADGSPLLLRFPPDYTLGSMWVSLGDLDEDPEGRRAWQDAWLLSADYTEVETPSALIAS